MDPNSQAVVGAHILKGPVAWGVTRCLPAPAGCGWRARCPLLGRVLILRAWRPILRAAGAGGMSEARGSSPHGSQCSHLRPLHPGTLSVLVWSGPGAGRRASWGLRRRWLWLPGLQLLASPLLPLKERLHHSLQFHGPTGRAAPGTRHRRRGRPLWGGGPAALQCGGCGGAGAVQGGGGRGPGPPGSGQGLVEHASGSAGRRAAPPHTGGLGAAVDIWLIHTFAETLGGKTDLQTTPQLLGPRSPH